MADQGDRDREPRDRPPRDRDGNRSQNRGSRPYQGGGGSRGPARGGSGSGSRSGGGSGGGSSAGGRPQGSSYRGKPSGPRRDYDRPRSGDRPPDRDYRSSGRDYDRPRDDRPRNDADRPRTYDDRPRRDYNDRPPRRDYGDQPRRDSADRPPRRDYTDRPRSNYSDRPPRRDYSDQPRRDYSDRPRRDYSDQPRRDASGQRDFDRPRRDYDARPRPDGDRPRDYDRPRQDVEPPRRDWQPRGGRPVGRPYTSRPFSERGPRPQRAPYVEPAVASGEFLGENEELVAGRRPVEEAFAARREAIRLLVVPERRAALDQLVIHATTLRIPVVELEGGSLTSLAGFDGHQGIALVAKPRQTADMEQILAVARARSQPPFVLVLDSLEDPQNFGTMLRSAEAVGVHGVFYPTKRSAPLSPSAIKASAGATEHLLLAAEEDLAATLADLHGRGLRIVAAEENAAMDYAEADLRGPLALVVGSEGRGISASVRRRVDLSVRIPMRGKIGSLNAAVAGSILLFAAAQQRPAPPARVDEPPTLDVEPQQAVTEAPSAKPKRTRKPKAELEAVPAAQPGPEAKPKRTVKPKAKAEAAAQPEAKPKRAAKPKPEAKAEAAAPAPEAKPKATRATKAKPKSTRATKAKPEAPAPAEAKPKRTAEPKAKATAKAEPAAKPTRTRKPKAEAAALEDALLPGDEAAG